MDTFLKDICKWLLLSLRNSKLIHSSYNPAGIYLLNVININTRTRCEICSKLTVKTAERCQKTAERCQWRRSGVSIVNFEHISHLVLVFLLLILNMLLPAGKVGHNCLKRGGVEIGALICAIFLRKY